MRNQKKEGHFKDVCIGTKEGRVRNLGQRSTPLQFKCKELLMAPIQFKQHQGSLCSRALKFSQVLGADPQRGKGQQSNAGEDKTPPSSWSKF